MNAVRPEPAEVWLNDGRPARFVWRGRLYTVLSVIERMASEPLPGERGPGRPRPGDQDRARARWECWRVTASPGKNIPAVAFQLCFDPAADRWLLTRLDG